MSQNLTLCKKTSFSIGLSINFPIICKAMASQCFCFKIAFCRCSALKKLRKTK